MSAPKGNRFWEARSSHGRSPIFKKPDYLWGAACEYFEWVEDNPLVECKVFHSQGLITKADVNKMRAMTIQGLCIFLGIARRTWDAYKAKEDFLPIIEAIEGVIYQQKLTGAAADLLNANIIAREIGLTDKKEIDHSVSVIKADDNEW